MTSNLFFSKTQAKDDTKPDIMKRACTIVRTLSEIHYVRVIFIKKITFVSANILYI